MLSGSLYKLLLVHSDLSLSNICLFFNVKKYLLITDHAVRSVNFIRTWHVKLFICCFSLFLIPESLYLCVSRGINREKILSFSNWVFVYFDRYKETMSRVYVGNLDPRVSERDLEDEFRRFGVIRRLTS